MQVWERLSQRNSCVKETMSSSAPDQVCSLLFATSEPHWMWQKAMKYTIHANKNSISATFLLGRCCNFQYNSLRMTAMWSHEGIISSGPMRCSRQQVQLCVGASINLNASACCPMLLSPCHAPVRSVHSRTVCNGLHHAIDGLRGMLFVRVHAAKQGQLDICGCASLFARTSFARVRMGTCWTGPWTPSVVMASQSFSAVLQTWSGVLTSNVAQRLKVHLPQSCELI